MLNYRYLRRQLELDELLRDKSCFLFGPRQTGKSTFIRNQLHEEPALIINLLDQSVYFEYSRNPGRLNEIINGLKLTNALIVIDEIQRIPDILNDVHLQIEDKGNRFLLTGSSARKLKRVGTNLLGGRARTRNLHPFSAVEIPDFSLEEATYRGTLPFIIHSKFPDEDLAAYVGRYLQEEIAAEGMSRNIPAFSRFLEVAACCNTLVLNYSSIASDTGMSRQTVTNYFQILKDTLIGFELTPFKRTTKRKATETSKFYLFDMGVVRFLRKLPKISKANDDFGTFFEHFVFLELNAWRDYHSPRSELNFWRSLKGEYEVDFIINNVAIEVKSSANVQRKHLSGLLALQEENICQKYIVVSLDAHKRYLEKENIWIYPWQDFIQELWAKKSGFWKN
ncbi:MAG: ATP-binding protein [Proteobacteria bacterium]|nr:ATP-binding protein [Pseudomonadota bacterium]